MRPLHALPTLKLISMLPGATSTLREHIESILKIRACGGHVIPRPCIKVK